MDETRMTSRRSRGDGTSRRRGLIAAVATAGVLLAAVLVACSESAEAPEHPFGSPPAAAPGIRAWAAGEPGVVLTTDDGGASWREQPFFLQQRGVDIAFPDARTGWLLTDGGTVLLSTDGGAAWKVVEQVDLTVKAIAAVSARHAWFVGNATGAAGVPEDAAVLHTTDGGETWQRAGFGMAQLVDVGFIDERRGVLVALDRIWSTRDGGRTWKLRRRLPMTVLTSVAVGESGQAWVAGWDTREGSPLVFATRDGGATWRRLRVEVPPAEPGALQAKQIAAADGTHVWVTCAAGVLATADGGKTWELQEVAAGQPLAVAAADEQHVVVSTEGQPLLATGDGGATWAAFGSAGWLEQPLVAITALATPSDAASPQE